MPGSNSSGGRAATVGSGALATNYGASTSVGPSNSGQFPFCNGPTGTQTIEEQIKQIDRITKVGF